ncbi:very low-density lipoprotein receptor, partial [Biomphalaria pfeifferi]
MFFRVCVLSLLVFVIVSAEKKQRQALCLANDFKCTNGVCIDATWKCDAEEDCSDGADEAGCPTDCSGPNMFKCANTKCIPAQYKCDNDDDCGDKSDETNC